MGTYGALKSKSKKLLLELAVQALPKIGLPYKYIFGSKYRKLSEPEFTEFLEFPESVSITGFKASK
ncbi:MAG: hypothetical protein LBC75_06385 [Fibromonadaceae bacterium]|nr:hypothetical protein [Fibromonadaceae bacterium]